MNRKLVSKSNLVLRKVLNKEEHIDILKDMIEGILDIKIESIRLNPYLKSKEKYLPKEENFGVADVRIITKEKESLNVGIQFIDGFYIQNKLLLYYAKIHTNQLEQQENQEIAKTITINILDFEYFDTQKFHKIIKIKDKPNEGGVEETIELHVIELPKWTCSLTKPITKEQAWVAYLAGIETESILKFEKIKKLDNLLKQYWEQEKIE